MKAPIDRALRHEFAGIEKEAALASRLNIVRTQSELDDVQIRAAARYTTWGHITSLRWCRCLVRLGE